VLSDAQATRRDPFRSSAKYQYFCTLIEQIRDSGEKALVFTSYRRMFSIFAEDLPERFGLSVLQIDGSTPPDMRQGVVDEFSAIDGSAVLVLNPTAAVPVMSARLWASSVSVWAAAPSIRRLSRPDACVSK
jgi:SNF2 family DNA or RNA helicase